jgi:hypothetical protein
MLPMALPAASAELSVAWSILKSNAS